MPVYQIADLFIEINPINKKTIQFLSEYKLSPNLSKKPYFDATVSQDELSEELKRKKYKHTKSYLVECSLIFKKVIRKTLDKYNGFFFHSSAISFDNKGLLFTAPSGTGKSTHTALWKKKYGNRVKIINDDKPLIRKIDNSFVAFGTPWMGKSNLGSNISEKVTAVYVLRQSNCNRITKAEIPDVFAEIIEATSLPVDKEITEKLLSILDEFLSSVPVYVLECTNDDFAVDVAEKGIL